jgi:hypothetical protein
MNAFPNAEVPISDADRTEIVAIFIDLMRARDAVPFGETGNPRPPLLSPPNSLNDLRSQWGLQ